MKVYLDLDYRYRYVGEFPFLRLPDAEANRARRTMGGKVPVPDEKMQVMIDRLRLSKSDQATFWKKFRKYDRDKSGTSESLFAADSSIHPFIEFIH